MILFQQLAARGVKVDVGPVKESAPPQPDHIPQEDLINATPSCRPTTPTISMTAALKDVGVVSYSLLAFNEWLFHIQIWT